MHASKSSPLALALTLSLIACGKEKAPEPAPTKATEPTPAQPTPTPPAADPDAMGSCEYTVEGGAPNKGGGGLNNVMSLHWFGENQKGRSLAVPLLINCGTGKQLNLSSAADATLADVPMAPKKYPIGAAKGDFVVAGADFMGGKGELEITAWDTSHVAGAFQFTALGKKVTGRFDIKCPQPRNGVCK